MPAESSYLIGLVRRILRLLSGVIVAVVLLVIFERIHLVDANRRGKLFSVAPGRA